MAEFCLLFDDIIYKLQNFGGITNYWREVTTRIAKSNLFKISRIKGNRLTRYFPVQANSDIFHSSYNRIALFSKAINIITVHDFIYELGYLKTSGSKINVYQKKLAINTADVIICVSENTKKDLLMLYPNSTVNSCIYVVEHGSLFASKNLETKKTSKRLISFKQATLNKYILFVGKRTSYKNFPAALSAFAGSSLPKMGYYMACIGAEFSDVEENLLSSLNLQQKVFFLENITDAELKYLYQNAFALVYPSLYEGFGLPALEAMSCGCPVIASQKSSIPEVVANAGVLVDPQDVEAISTAIDSLLDERLRSSYILKGRNRAKLFSWDKAAQKHIQIYQDLLN